MSGLIVGLVMRTPVTKKFDGAVKFTAMIYAEHAWPDGTHAHPAVETVAKFMGCSNRSVQRYVKVLVEMGMLIPAGYGPKGTNQYSFPLIETAEGDPRLDLRSQKKGGDKLSPPETGGGDTESGDTESGDTMLSPERKNRYLNPSTTTGEPANIKLYPTTIPEADQNPLIRVFREVSGIFPGQPYWVNIIDAIQFIGKAHGIRDQEGLKDLLTPYWLAWSTRKNADGEPYSKLNPTWLIEWAVSGQIPPVKQRGQNDKLSSKDFAGQSGRKTNSGSGSKPVSAQQTPEQLAAIERINAKRRERQPASG